MVLAGGWGGQILVFRNCAENMKSVKQKSVMLLLSLQHVHPQCFGGGGKFHEVIADLW